MALALYRKYRPATFGEVVGQEHVTDPLRTALSSGRINHAYLFSGPRGCGKTSSARILARSLNCDEGPTADPCGTCESCVALGPEGAGSVDVIELDAASHGGVDDTRELRDRAFFAPARSRYRIFVIDEAHMVTTQGFNALLKIVEEPPEHLIFVFATTEPDKVLTTIRSRTHHYPFRLMPPGVLRGLLQRICDEEGVTVEPAVYPLVIRAGGGSARDTLSILDQLLAGAGEEGVTYERAVALLGVTDVALIDDMVDALAAADSAVVYGTVDRLVEAGHDPRRFGSDLLDRLRDLVLLHSVPDAAERGLIDVHGDELTRMQHQAENLGAATLSRFAEIVHTGLGEMRGATAPRLLLELMCARMLLPTASDSQAALLQRLERVERRMTIAPAGESGAGEPTVGQGDSSDASDGQRRVFQRPSERAAQPEQAAAPARDSAPTEGSATSATDTSANTDSAPNTGAERQPEPTAPEPESVAPAVQATEPVAEPAQPESAQSEPAQPEPAGVEETEPARPEPVQAAQSQTGYDTAEVRRIWTGVLQAVAERNRPTQALLLNATVQELRGSTLVLSMPTSGLVKQLAQQRRLDFIRDALSEVLGGEWEIQCVEAGAAPPAAERKPSQQEKPSSQEKPAQQRNPTQPQRSAGREQQEQHPGPSNGAPRGDSGGAQRPSGGESATVPDSPEPDDVPPPPEPQPEDEPPPDDVPPPPETSAPPVSDDENPEAMFAESSPADAPQVRRDQNQVAVDLLSRELGARRVDH